MIGAAALMFVVLAILIAFGVQVAIAIGAVSIVTLFAATGDFQAVARFILAAAYQGLRSDALLAVPLLTLMGLFITRSGAAADVFWAANRAMRGWPGGAPLAAVLGAAVHAFSVFRNTAAIANFSRIAYPELKRRGYDRGFSLGMVTSAAVLGLLLPPGTLMVAWGFLGHQPAGAIFLAAMTPALLIALGLGVAVIAATRNTQTPHTGKMSARPARALGSVIGLTLIFTVVLGGIGLRLLGVVEAAAAGMAIALMMALAKGMRLGGIIEAVMVAARVVGPFLALLFAALLYERALTVTGAGEAISLLIGGLNPVLGLSLMVLVWLVLATMLDALSVLVLTVTLFAPAARLMGLDPLAFAVIGLIVPQAALVLPPLGLLVFAIKAMVNDHAVAVVDIFRYVLPLLVILLAAVVFIAAFPKIAVWPV